MISRLRAILKSEDWQHFAATEAKTACFLWLIAGGIYQWWIGRFLSLPTLLLFLPGIFLASFVQIIPAMVNALKKVRLTEMKTGVRRSNTLELMLWTVWSVADLALVPALAILCMRALDAIL